MYGMLLTQEPSAINTCYLLLLVGSEVVFIGKKILDFETVHLSFLKNMLGVKQQTTSVTIYGDMGRYPLYLKQ